MERVEHTEHVENSYPAPLDGTEITGGEITAMLEPRDRPHVLSKQRDCSKVGKL